MILILIKLNHEFEFEFKKVYEGIRHSFGQSVKQTHDGGYITTGSTDSEEEGEFDVYLLKTDAIGNPQFEKTFGGSEEDLGTAIDILHEGGYIIIGTTKSQGFGAQDIYLIKTDSEGNLIFNKTYGGSLADYGSTVQQTKDGGFALFGWTDTSYTIEGISVYLIKTNADGYYLH